MVANLVSAILLALVGIVLFLTSSKAIVLVAVIGQGLCQGFCSFTSQVFKFQCLRRGTTVDARARTLKWTFTVGPISAVAGSLGTQLVLGGSLSWLPYPYDFGLLYLLAVPCMTGVAFLSSRYQLVQIEQGERPSIALYLKESMAFFLRQRTLILIWVAYLLWRFTASSISNLSLYGREVLGQDPKEFSGIVLALRFGFKSLGGFILGVIAIRRGIRAPLLFTAVLLGSSVLWGWMAPGYFYFLAFGILGAGELGGAYFPNYVVSISSAVNTARNLSLLTLVIPFSGIGPAAHGALADLYGFPRQLPLWFGHRHPVADPAFPAPPESPGAAQSVTIGGSRRGWESAGVSTLDDGQSPRHFVVGDLEPFVDPMPGTGGQGKVRVIGYSNHTSWHLCRMLWLADVHGPEQMQVVQPPHSLVNCVPT